MRIDSKALNELLNTLCEVTKEEWRLSDNQYGVNAYTVKPGTGVPQYQPFGRYSMPKRELYFKMDGFIEGYNEAQKLINGE